MPSPDTITVQQLSKLIGTPQSPVIIDVRIDEDFDAAPRLIPSAIRHPFPRITTLVPLLAGRTAVIVCHKGLKISQGAAAMLRANGIAAEVLDGGFVAWQERGEPLVPADNIPPRNAEGQTVWVTRHRPKIDRIACPWLIRRFVDPTAQFLFVSPSEVLAVADRFNATPFDVPDVAWSHQGDLCTFDTMVAAFDLKTEPLLRLATIVRAADTDRHDLAPEAAGLLAVSLGLSRMYRDDLQQLEAGIAVYDAFYRWARDARDESHDWPPVVTGG